MDERQGGKDFPLKVYVRLGAVIIMAVEGTNTSDLT